MLPIFHFAAVFFALLAAGGLGYLALSVWCEGRYLRRLRRAAPLPDFTPPVSILKPLRGCDRRMYESFRSHCLQDYPQFEIIFGVSDADDEAVSEVARLRREFPACDIKLVVCPEILGSNRKVSNLVQMYAAARYDHVLINDSDILVEPDYLRRVLAPLSDDAVGMVTALYRASCGRAWAARVESVGIATDFVGGVLCAVELDGALRFGLGSTLACSRRALDAIGGLAPLVDYLADDNELGRRIAEAGFKVALASSVVSTHLPDYGWRAMFEHQLRWARTVRDARRWGYVGLLFTFALPWALLAAVCAGGALWSLALLLAVAVVRFASAALLAGPILADRRTLHDLWLVPLRDCVALALWLASFAGNSIVWRGERFRLDHGRLVRR